MNAELAHEQMLSSDADLEARIIASMEARDFDEADKLLDALRARHAEPLLS